MRRLLLSISILVTLSGCGSYFTNMGHNAANGALDAVTSDDAKKKLAGLTTDATKAARDEALGPDTDAKLQKLITDAGLTTRQQLEQLITDALQERIRKTVRIAVDEVGSPMTLKEADALREELLGAPLQKDINDLIDAAAPHLAAAVQQSVQSSLQPIKTEESAIKTAADAEAAKWKPIAIGFAVGSGFLLVCLILAVILIRGHRKMIDKHQEIIASLIAQRKSPSAT